MHRFDLTDARIMLALDEHPQATVMALARTLDLARNTVSARAGWLEQEALAPPSRRLEPRVIGLPLIAFVTMEISQDDLDRTVHALEAIPEILELHATSGDGDLLARVSAADPEDLHRVTRLMVSCPGVMRSRTSIGLRELIGLRTRPLLERLVGA